TDARSIKEINALITYSAVLDIKGVQFKTALISQTGSPILINKDGFILDGNGSFLTGRIKDCMIHVTANNVTLRNVRGTNFDGNMVCVENATGTQIESCEFTESTGAGLLIKNSSVTATNLKTKINKKGGVIVSGLTAKRKFTMTSGTLFEKEAVWTEDSKDFINLPAEYVATTTGIKTVWTNGSSPIVYFTPEGAGNKTGESLDNAYDKSIFKTILSSSPENCIMKLGAGTYDYTSLSPIEIKKTVTIEGSDSAKCIIKGNIEIKGTSTQAVTFKKVKINSTATAINITNPQLTLTLDAVSIDGTYGVQFNSFTAEAAPTYIVKNSHIHASTHYALRTRSNGTYNWTIENSKIEGWCALYMSLGTPTITVTNSHLYGTNKQPGGTDPVYTNGAAGDGFATIVFESTLNGNITLDNTDVKSFWTEVSTCRRVQNSIIFQVNEDQANTQKLGVKNNTVALKNASSLYIDRPEYAPIFIYHGASHATYGKEENNWVTTDGTATFSYGANKKQPLVVKTSTGNIRTVIAPIQEGIDNLNYWTADNDIITVPVGTIELTKQLIVNKPIILQGAGANTIIAAVGDAWPKNEKGIISSSANLISIQGKATGTVALKDLTIQGSKASGINAQSAMATTLNNVTLKNNANAGMVVHSKVDATGLHTEGNTWGGVNVDKGTPDYANLVFGFDATSTFAEVNKVWSEITDKDAIVNVPAGWRNFIAYDEENKKNMRYWTTQKTTSTTEVANDKELVFAIKAAQKGETILLTAATYGTEATPALMGEVKVDNVTIKAKDGLTAPKVYGTIKVLAEGCTIDGLEMYTKSDGTAALKNIIDVVAMSVTITNNVFHMLTPTAGNVSNGVCIWPYGTSDNPAYVVKGNTFNDFNAVVPKWGSTAMLVTEGLELSRFTGFTTSDKSKVVTLVNEKDFLTGNTFTNCDLDYTHADWAAGTNTNVKGEAPYYSFTGNSNVGAFKDAVIGSVTKAYIEASFITEKQALAALNPESAIAHANAVPDSIVINCKDAYLVTGEKAAKAFAATERDKAVFWLKRATAADYTFSTVAVGNNWRIIDGNTTWNDAANVNRSVEIKAGAKLTINVAMALDSVRMDEGAELITALPVTAKTLQAKYTVAANKWKPFAFPVSGM
ncbi:MAG: hypothetical protein RR382_09920, partial [Tannerellaceae bacterium]